MAGDVGVSGSLLPWVLSIGGGIVTALIGVVGKLWVSLGEERAARALERDQLRHELAEANDRIVELQAAAAVRSDAHRGEHLRDLRRLAGLSTSIEPPPRADQWPPVVIREAVARPPPPARKPR